MQMIVEFAPLYCYAFAVWLKMSMLDISLILLAGYVKVRATAALKGDVSREAA